MYKYKQYIEYENYIIWTLSIHTDNIIVGVWYIIIYLSILGITVSYSAHLIKTIYTHNDGYIAVLHILAHLLKEENT